MNGKFILFYLKHKLLNIQKCKKPKRSEFEKSFIEKIKKKKLPNVIVNELLYVLYVLFVQNPKSII